MSTKTTIKLKRSFTAGSKPVNLEDGEIAINLKDGCIFVKRNAEIEPIFTGDRHIINRCLNTIEQDTELKINENASSIGLIIVSDSATVNVPDDSLWFVID